MSFGFSVGDFIAVGKLISEAISCLQAVGGARSEYQELIREFQALDAALRHLDRLNSNDPDSTRVDSIKYAALSCRHPLEEFLAKIKRYENSLDSRSCSGAVRSTADKIRWTFGQKDDIKRLQTYLNVHIGTINMLLAQYGLERIHVTSKKSEADALRIYEQVNTTQTMVIGLQQSVPAQALVLHKVYSMLGSVYDLVRGDIKSSLDHLEQIVSTICVTTQQIYTVVVQIRDSAMPVDTRWTHFQAPLVVEDALGYKFPVPSEYDFEMLVTIIQQRFKSGSGAREVRAGNYELCRTRRKSEVVTATSRLVPGTAITMAIIVAIPSNRDTVCLKITKCPMPHCRSSEISQCQDTGGSVW
ncbi:hypothetical protein P153DRAFT_374341 [Dothidotthia symphoricarpi CBS 119687]|uniref:Ubiquitin-like domain-containing protein n=1 Tax=Dothidotthia symphoricarpi CBS 119687 TaxID=1392245 RepID=A0A6A6AK49_9PLEO|nr:uncharacterized protein P153DRAFT_374341 [Dothidotthia symphoricarpi CBS 119687]KAF2131475.1 hypothetical protein P153DRAFT_374341 [Dothidotthia symphoricarpi CBS 119687]